MTTQGFSSSARRISRAEAIAELHRVQASADVPRALESFAALDSPLAILNAQRQVIFSNRAFQQLAGSEGVEGVCGRRPGEALDCIHSRAGCGESEACGFCGARRAIVETQVSGRPAAHECHVTVDGAKGYDLVVSTMPFEIAGSAYVLVSFRDISDRKRRSALERIFFHDLLNTASSLRLSVDLLRRGDLPEDHRLNLLERLSDVCDLLWEEIESQKLMLSAENGTLRTQRNLIESRALALQVIRQAEGLAAAQGRRIITAPFSESFPFVSDDALVRRVLGNMIKNALEACPPGADVTIAFRRGEDGRAVVSVHNPTVMDRSVQLQVFQRYFSTKGEGRGLGTWGMKLLAEEYLGGSVEFNSSPEAGTTFSLTLPSKPSEH